MARLFPDSPGVLARTMEIAERCNFKLHKVDNPWPQFAVPEGHTIDSYFEEICRNGFKKRMETSVRQLEMRGQLRSTRAEYEARLNYEIGIIRQMKYSGYFLIVWDFIKYAKDNGIPVGPGRGSGAGSLVAYSMGITNIDPLQNVLLFERFLNPERVSMPDIDVDFCQNRRGEVIDYVVRKYGREQVSQIITFNTMAAKAAIKDCGRALDMPYGDVDRIAKLVPATVGMTLDQAMTDVPELAKAYETDPQIRELLDTAKKLEGLVRGQGVHASAVVIAPRALTELVPVVKTKNDEIVTAYDMKSVDKMGLLKMDFLGLATLTVIDDCLKLIEKSRGEKVDIEAIPLDDAETYKKVFQAALTSGVFQFESNGMRDMLRRYKPDKIEDLTALTALFRPRPDSGRHDGRLHRAQVGTAQGGVHAAGDGEGAQGDAGRHRLPGAGNANCQRAGQLLAGRSRSAAPRHGQKKARGDGQAARSLHERRRGAGASQGHGGRSLRPDGEVCRIRLQQVALGGLRTGFVPDGLFEDALPGGVHGGAADFGNLEAGKRGQVHPRVQGDGHQRGTARRAGVGLAVHAAHYAEGEAIRFGLAAVKNVGGNAIESILKAREEVGGRFSNLWEFCEKVDLRVMNKRVIESLIKAGALDSMGKRGPMMAAVDKAMEQAQKAQKDRESGQAGLFGLFDEGPKAVKGGNDLPKVPDWEEGERLTNEKEVLGFFVSGHPLGPLRRKAAQSCRRDFDFRSVGAQAAGAPLGQADRPRG